MTARKSTTRRKAPKAKAARPANALPESAAQNSGSAQEKLQSAAISRIHEAQAIVAMVGSMITFGEVTGAKAEARASLALAGAEELLDRAFDAVDNLVAPGGAA